MGAAGSTVASGASSSSQQHRHRLWRQKHKQQPSPPPLSPSKQQQHNHDPWPVRITNPETTVSKTKAQQETTTDETTIVFTSTQKEEERLLEQQYQRELHELARMAEEASVSSSSSVQRQQQRSGSPPTVTCSGNWLLNNANAVISSSVHSPIMTLSASSGSLFSNSDHSSSTMSTKIVDKDNQAGNDNNVATDDDDTIIFSFASGDEESLGLFIDYDDESSYVEEEDDDQMLLPTSIHVATHSLATTRREDEERRPSLRLQRTQSFDDDHDAFDNEVDKEGADNQASSLAQHQREDQLQLVQLPQESSCSSASNGSSTKYHSCGTTTTASTTPSSTSNGHRSSSTSATRRHAGEDRRQNQRQHPRMVDIYQTDCTLLVQPSLDDDDEDSVIAGINFSMTSHNTDQTANDRDNNGQQRQESQHHHQPAKPLIVPFRTCARATCPSCGRKDHEAKDDKCIANKRSNNVSNNKTIDCKKKTSPTYGGPIGDWDIRPPLPKSSSSSSSVPSTSSPAQFIQRSTLPPPPTASPSLLGAPPSPRGNRSRGLSEDFSDDDAFTTSTATSGTSSSGDDKENHQTRNPSVASSSSRRCRLPPAKTLFRQSSSSAMTTTSCSSRGSAGTSTVGDSTANSVGNTRSAGNGFTPSPTGSATVSPYSQYHKQRSRSEDYVDVPYGASRRSSSPSSVGTQLLPPPLPRVLPRLGRGSIHSSSCPVLPSVVDTTDAQPRGRASSCDVGFQPRIESPPRKTRCRSEDVVDDCAVVTSAPNSNAVPVVVSNSSKQPSHMPNPRIPSASTGSITSPSDRELKSSGAIRTPPRRQNNHHEQQDEVNQGHSMSTPTSSSRRKTIATTPSPASKWKERGTSTSSSYNSPMGVAEECWNSAQHHHREDTVNQQKKPLHASALSSRASRTSWRKLLSYGSELEEQGQLKLALQTYRQCVDCFQQEGRNGGGGRGNVEYLQYQWTCSKLHSNIASIHYKMGNYRASLQVLEHSLEMSTLAMGCITLNEALSSLMESQQGATQDHYQHIDEELDTPTPSPLLQLQGLVKTLDFLEWIAELLISKGRAYLSMGRLHESKRWLKKALSILEKVQDDQGNLMKRNAGMADHPSKRRQRITILLAMAIVGMGQAYEASDRFHDAMSHYQHGLRLQRFCLGDNHPHVATTISCIGSIHLRYGYFGPSMNCFMESLRIYRLNLSKVPSSAFTKPTPSSQPHALRHASSPVDVGVTLASIAWIHYACGNLSAAMKACTDALTIVQTLLGPTHRDTGSIQYQIGLIQLRQGLTKQALKVFKGVLHTQQATLGDDHDDIVITLDAIATSYGQLRRWKKAITYMDRVFEFHARRSKQSLPSSSWREQQKRRTVDVKLAMSYSRMGNLYHIMGDDHVGHTIECWSKALHLYQSNGIPPNDWRVVQLQQALTGVKDHHKVAY